MRFTLLKSYRRTLLGVPFFLSLCLLIFAEIQWAICFATLNNNLGIITLTQLLVKTKISQEPSKSFSSYTMSDNQQKLLDQQFVAQLVQAKNQIKPNVILYQKFGELFRKHGAYEWAILAFERAHGLSANNKQIIRELAETYDLVGQYEQANLLWGVLTDNMLQTLSLADSYFQERQFDYALRWYKFISVSDNKMQPKIAFQMAISTLMTQEIKSITQREVLQQLCPDLKIFKLNDQLVIQGEELRWMEQIPNHGITFGTSLQGSIDTQPLSGRFWWSGEAIAVFQVQEEVSSYHVAIRMQHDFPPPIKMAVGVDGRQLKSFELSKGDESWTIENFDLKIDSGIHILNVWFLNNSTINGNDRDAAVDWVQFNKKH